MKFRRQPEILSRLPRPTFSDMKLSEPAEVPRPLRYPPCSSATHSHLPSPTYLPGLGRRLRRGPREGGAAQRTWESSRCRPRRVPRGAGPAPPAQSHPVATADATPPPRGGPPSPPRPRPRASDPPLSRQAQLRSAALESCRRGPGKGEETPLSRPSGAGSSAQAASRPVSRDVTSVSPAPGEGGD